jgi:hypothetical protein
MDHIFVFSATRQAIAQMRIESKVGGNNVSQVKDFEKGDEIFNFEPSGKFIDNLVPSAIPKNEWTIVIKYEFNNDLMILTLLALFQAVEL